MFDTDLEFEFESASINTNQLISTIYSKAEKMNDVSFETKYLPFPEQSMDFVELEAILDD